MMDALSRLTAALADRYRIERELGQGGMATVYLAEDLKHERQVAIKVLREDLSASLGSGRFLREIKIAAQLQHPHILPLLDSGEADGFLYFVMPYVSGQSLRERLARDGELPVPEAVRLISEVVDALVEAHAHGVVHRDIKPDNVMLSGRHALVTDFGVAKAISEATGRNTVTTLGVAVGTPTYMSPEQAAADPHVDHRSDIYSVGVMAYEMLSGRPPFTGNTPQQVLAAHVTEAPDPVSKRRPAIPAALEQVVMRCLAKRPADRYQTASELHAALEPLAASTGGVTPTQSQPVGITRRRPLIFAAAVVLAVGLLYAVTHFPRPGIGASPPTQITFTGRVVSVSMSPDGAFLAYNEFPDCVGDVPCLQRLVIQEASAQGTHRVVDSSGSAFVVAWSPDGRRFLLGTAEGGHSRRSIVTILGGEVVHSLDGKAAWTASPDSIFVWDWLASANGQTWIRTANASSGTPTDSFSFGPAKEIRDIYPSPDGRLLLIQYQDSAIFKTPSLVLTSRKGVVLDTVPYLNGVVGWSPRSNTIYLKQLRGLQGMVLRQHVAATGRRVGKPEFVLRTPSTAISLSGRTLAYVDVGLPETEVWAIEWPNGLGRPPLKRSVHRTTARVTDIWINDAGDRIGVDESMGTGDSARKNTLTFSFDKGALVETAPADESGIDYSGSVSDTSARVTGEYRNGRTVLTWYDNRKSTKGRILPTTFPDSGWVNMLPANRILWQPHAGREFVVLDERGQILHRFPWPDSLGSSGGTLTPDRTAFTILANRRLGDSTNVTVYTLTLADGHITRLAGPFPGDQVMEWAGDISADGWLPLLRTDALRRRHLIRVQLATGDVVDDGALPIDGLATKFWYSNDRRHAAAASIKLRSDVMLLRNFDPTAH